MTKYNIVLCETSIVLRYKFKTLLSIHNPEKTIDTKFYKKQEWGIIHGGYYAESRDTSGFITIRNKKEVNAALVQAEITHRLSKS